MNKSFFRDLWSRFVQNFKRVAQNQMQAPAFRELDKFTTKELIECLDRRFGQQRRTLTANQEELEKQFEALCRHQIELNEQEEQVLQRSAELQASISAREKAQRNPVDKPAELERCNAELCASEDTTIPDMVESNNRGDGHTVSPESELDTRNELPVGTDEYTGSSDHVLPAEEKSLGPLAQSAESHGSQTRVAVAQHLESNKATEDFLLNDRSTIPPEKRGGGVAGALVSAPKPDPENGLPKNRIRTQLVCYRRGMAWRFGIEVMTNGFNENAIEISQGGARLAPVPCLASVYPLNSLTERIVIRCGELEDTVRVMPPEQFIIFKLVDQGDVEFGIQVDSVNRGHYGIATPSNWRINSPADGLSDRQSEFCGDLRLHFLDGSKADGAILVVSDEDEHHGRIATNSCQVRIVGLVVGEADGVPIFGGEPPNLHDLPIGTAMVVLLHENDERPRWKSVIERSEHDSIVSLNIKNRVAGRFSARIYNGEARLIDSVSFWYASFLHSIFVESPPIEPDPKNTDAPESATVTIIHEEGVEIEAFNNTHGELAKEIGPGKTKIRIPLSADFLKTKWLINKAGHQGVPIEFTIPTVVWRCKRDDEDAQDWGRAPRALQRNDFKATSDTVLEIKHSIPDGLTQLRLGFRQSQARDFGSLAFQREIQIPLREFSESSQHNEIGEHTIKLWFTHDNASVCLNIGQLSVRAICYYCKTAFESIELAQNHVFGNHMESCFRELTTEELQKRYPDIPLQIYKCAFCTHFVKEKHKDSAFSAINSHLDKCEYAPKVHGLPVHRFTVVDDPQEIRRNWENTLPQVYRCAFCGEEMENSDEGAKVQHLADNHLTCLYKLG